ncbi:MAG: SEC-C domain-containing protein [Chloroflexaceae bacterium]|nr:SEC-C domain-containing protein [Chloroflexaceae bacterium]
MAKATKKQDKLGRNDPCWCGSGRKYKECHLPIEEQQQAERRKLHQAQDTLMPKIIEAAQEMTAVIPSAFVYFWTAKYDPAQLLEIDDLEDRGSERFLNWLVFDYPLDDGLTLVGKLAQAAEAGQFDVDEYEARLLQSWTTVRLQPYVVLDVQKGTGLTVRHFEREDTYQVLDKAASRRIEVGEIMIAHLVPIDDTYAVSGVAAQLTADIHSTLQELVAMHLIDMRKNNPEAGWDDFLRERSGTFNHFVMVAPVEETDISQVQMMVTQMRATLEMTGRSFKDMVGLGQKDDSTDEQASDAMSDGGNQPDSGAR